MHKATALLTISGLGATLIAITPIFASSPLQLASGSAVQAFGLCGLGLTALGAVSIRRSLSER